jgi:hypothetical protein
MALLSFYQQLKMFSISEILQRKGAFLQKPRYRLKILRTRRVTWSKFYPEHQKILVATVQNSVAQAISK